MGPLVIAIVFLDNQQVTITIYPASAAPTPRPRHSRNCAETRARRAAFVKRRGPAGGAGARSGATQTRLRQRASSRARTPPRPAPTVAPELAAARSSFPCLETRPSRDGSPRPAVRGCGYSLQSFARFWVSEHAVPRLADVLDRSRAELLQILTCKDALALGTAHPARSRCRICNRQNHCLRVVDADSPSRGRCSGSCGLPPRTSTRCTRFAPESAPIKTGALGTRCYPRQALKR